MSERQKYPGLYAGCKLAGLNYATILNRVKAGMPIKVALAKPVGPSRGRPAGKHWLAEDTSPLAVRRLREAYCEKFLKTGQLDADMAAKLQRYANACRKAPRNSNRVSAEHEAAAVLARRGSDGRTKRRRDDDDLDATRT